MAQRAMKPVKRQKRKCWECVDLRQRLQYAIEAYQHAERVGELLERHNGKDHAMLDVLCRALETSSRQFQVLYSNIDGRVDILQNGFQVVQKALAEERADTVRLIEDLKLAYGAGAHMLCGSHWVRGEAIQAAIARYTFGDSQAVQPPGGCAK